MSKKHNNTRPTDWLAPRAEDPVAPSAPQTQQDAAEPEREPPVDVPISVPLSAALEGYAQRHIDLQLLHGQAVTLRRLTVGLDQRGATLKSGRRVTLATEALRWLLEQLVVAE